VSDCTASMPSATIAQAAVAAVPTISATGVRPGARPARTALGSNGAPAAGVRLDSVMGGSLLPEDAVRGYALGAELVYTG
jgi:hypothetical protein